MHTCARRVAARASQGAQRRRSAESASQCLHSHRDDPPARPCTGAPKRLLLRQLLLPLIAAIRVVKLPARGDDAQCAVVVGCRRRAVVNLLGERSATLCCVLLRRASAATSSGRTRRPDCELRARQPAVVSPRSACDRRRAIAAVAGALGRLCNGWSTDRITPVFTGHAGAVVDDDAAACRWVIHVGLDCQDVEDAAGGNRCPPDHDPWGDMLTSALRFRQVVRAARR